MLRTTQKVSCEDQGLRIPVTNPIGHLVRHILGMGCEIRSFYRRERSSPERWIVGARSFGCGRGRDRGHGYHDLIVQLHSRHCN